jgi:hypothetical protein
MFDFRIQGFDILPNIIGYILFAMAFRTLSSCSQHFSTAGIFDAIMIILSIFTVYQEPNNTVNTNVYYGPFGYWGLAISVASVVFNLLVIYNLFIGIEDMAYKYNKVSFSEEAESKWHMYITFQAVTLIFFALSFTGFISILLFVILFIASIAVMATMMNFMRRCGEQF